MTAENKKCSIPWTASWDMLKSVYDPAWWEKQVAFADEVQKKINVVEVSSDVALAVANTHYLVDATSDPVSITLPDVTSGDEWIFRVTLSVDTHAVSITTTWWTQLIWEDEIKYIQTMWSSLFLQANGVDWYYILWDSREYYRTIDLVWAWTTDLTDSWYESGAIYHCEPWTWNTRTIIIPDASLQCNGNFAKFILDWEWDVVLYTESWEEIKWETQQTITSWGFELTCFEDHYWITQDSRPKELQTSLNIYWLSESSGISTYNRASINTSDSDYSETPTDFTTVAITGDDILLGWFITNEDVIEWLLNETSMLWFANFRKATGNSDANFYVEIYKRNSAWTETLLGTSNLTQTITSASYVQATISWIISSTTFLSTDRVLVKLYGNKVWASTSPTYDIQLEWTSPAYVSITVPAWTVAHNWLAWVQLAWAGVTYWHINDKAQTIVWPKEFEDKTTMWGKDEVAKTYTPATWSQTVTIDCSVNNQHIVTGNASWTAITFAVSNVTNNQIFSITINQWAVVSTIAWWFATIKWEWWTAPTLTPTANKSDTFVFMRTWTDTYNGFVVWQNL